MSKAQYRAMLRDPRWQRVRLRVFERDGWSCQHCGATRKELQVHHVQYIWAWKPWEYPMRLLVTLCVDCHRAVSRRKRRKATKPSATTGTKVP
jgi:5-methylcytosine-specific restriction endonuclease McrA